MFKTSAKRLNFALVTAILALLLISPDPHHYYSQSADLPHTVGQVEPDTQASVAQQKAISPNLDKLPLRFEQNKGQSDASVRFLVRGAGYILLLTNSAALMYLSPATPPQHSGAADQHLSQTHPGASIPSVVLCFQLEGANANPVISGEQELPGESNYLIGNDPTKWYTHIHAYNKVRYTGVYKGIDAVYYASKDAVEHDFIVAPGAHPEDIKMSVIGATNIKVVAGSLVISTTAGEVRQSAPDIYQNGPNGQERVAGEFLLNANNLVGFSVSAYDPTRPLIIDPSLSYSTYLGGSAEDRGNDLALGSDGSTYITGDTHSVDFYSTTGVLQPSCAVGTSCRDAFVTKLNASGSQLIYSTYIGGPNDDYAMGIATDSSGNAYITGAGSAGYPVTPNAYQPTPGVYGDGDAFLSKLSADGTQLLYSTFLANSVYGSDGWDIAVNGSNAYVVGHTHRGFIPTDNGYRRDISGGFNVDNDGFVVEVNTQQAIEVYGSYIGGEDGFSYATGIALGIDPYLNHLSMFVTGATTSNPSTGQTNPFPITPEVFQPHNKGGFDAFVTEFDPFRYRDQSVTFSSLLGGTLDEGSLELRRGGIAVDTDDSGLVTNIYLVGSTNSVDFPTTRNAYQHYKVGNQYNEDAYVTKLSVDGPGIFDPVYATYLGGASDDFASDVAVNGQHDVFVTGWTNSTGSSGTFPLFNPIPSAPFGYDAFVAEINPDYGYSASLIYSTFLGDRVVDPGNGNDFATAIVVDHSGNAYVTGYTNSSVFYVTSGALQTAKHDGFDGFVSKIAPGPCLLSYAQVVASDGPNDTDYYEIKVPDNCSSTNISAQVPIGRYYGPLTDPQAHTGTIDPHALGKTVDANTTVEIVTNGISPYEVLNVSLNGHNFTVGGEDIYFESPDYVSRRVSVPTSWLVLPSNGGILRQPPNTADQYQIIDIIPPEYGQNMITISRGNNSYGQVVGIKLMLKGMYPLLLVGGNGCPRFSVTPAWDHIIKLPTAGEWWPGHPYDQDPGAEAAIESFVEAVPRDWCAPIDYGGADVGKEVTAASEAYGVRKVNILGDSGGGLWVRSAAENTGYNIFVGANVSVNNALLLGTPNEGSYRANQLWFLGWTKCAQDPMSCQLFTDRMKEYDKHHNGVPGVRYIDLMGRTILKAYDETGGSITYTADDDSALTLDSSQSLDRYSGYNTVHLGPLNREGSLSLFDVSHSVHYIEPKDVGFRDCFAQYFMISVSPPCTADPPIPFPGDSGQTIQAAVVNSSTLQPSVFGNATSSQVSSATIMVDDANLASFDFSWFNPTATLSLTLTDPVGRVVAPTNHYPGSAFIAATDEGVYGGEFRITNPMVGQWHMDVQILTSTNQTEPFEIGGSFVGGVQLNPEVSSPTTGLAQPVVITATLQDSAAITGAAVTASVSLPFQGRVNIAQINLVEQPGGIYRGVFTPQEEGTYIFDVLAHGNNSEGHPFVRGDSLRVTASNAASFDNLFSALAYDNNNDGLYDSLVITSSTTISSVGRYRLSGLLTNGSGSVAASSSQSYTATLTGTTPLTLTFSGKQIAQSLLDGPYQLRDLTLSRILTDELDLASIPVAYTVTTPTSRYDWQRDNVMQAGVATDQGVDNNGDHLFDYLKVVVPVDVRTPGRYTASANLLAPDGHTIAAAYTPGLNMVTGTNTIVLRFDGGQINNSGTDGPYSVKDMVVSPVGSSNYTSIDVVLDPTQQYHYTEFGTSTCPSFLDVPQGYIFYDYITYLACHQIMNGTDSTHFSPSNNTLRSEFAQVLVKAFGLQLQNPANSDFTDVNPGDLFYQAIESVYLDHDSQGQQIMSGYPLDQCVGAGTPTPTPPPSHCFKPSDYATRGQIAQGVRRGANLPQYTPTPPGQDFYDVTPTDPFFEPIESLYHLAIVSGQPCSTPTDGQCYRPLDPISRGELSRVIYKAIQYLSPSPTPRPIWTFTPSPTPTNTPTNTPTITNTPTNTPTTTPTPDPCALRILVIAADNHNEPTVLENALRGQSGVTQVDYFDATSATPSGTQLQSYNEVVTYSNYGGYADPSTLGSVLASFEDGGGTVVMLDYAFYQSGNNYLGGSWQTPTDHNPFVNNASLNWTANSRSMGGYDRTSPYMVGVSTLTANHRANLQVAAGATVVANWSDGLPLVAVKGHTVALNGYFGPADQALFGGDYARVIVNAGQPGLTSCPTSTATPTSTPGTSLRILLATADHVGEPTTLHQSLISAAGSGGTVDYVDLNYSTPPASYLKGYDEIVTYAHYGLPNAAAWGDALAAYYQARPTGEVVVLNYTFSSSWGNTIGGAWQTGSYSPFSLVDSSITSNAHLGGGMNSPYLAGVGILVATYRAAIPVASGASLEASWSDGLPLVAVKGRSLGINAYLGEDFGGGTWSGDYAHLIVNAAHQSNPIYPTPTATATPTPSCQLRILLVTSDQAAPSQLQQALTARSEVALVDYADASYGSPSLSYLKGYDEVVTFSNYDGYLYPELLGSNLADFDDSGGVVASLDYAHYGAANNYLGGRWQTGGYNPFNLSASLNWTNSEVTLGQYNANSPYMAGVQSLGANHRANLTRAYGTQLVASWSDGLPLLTAKGRSIGINAYLSSLDGASWSGDFARLLVNAGQAWKVGCATPTPTSTTVATPVSYGISGYVMDSANNLLSGQQEALYTLLTSGSDYILGSQLATVTSNSAGFWKLRGSLSTLPTNFAGFAVVQSPSTGYTASSASSADLYSVLASASRVDWHQGLYSSVGLTTFYLSSSGGMMGGNNKGVPTAIATMAPAGQIVVATPTGATASRTVTSVPSATQIVVVTTSPQVTPGNTMSPLPSGTMPAVTPSVVQVTPTSTLTLMPPASVTATASETMPPATPSDTPLPTATPSSATMTALPTNTILPTLTTPTPQPTTPVALTPTPTAGTRTYPTATDQVGTPTPTGTVGMENAATTATEHGFSDVPLDNPFYPDIAYLATRGIIGGVPNGDGSFRFAPYQAVTRGELTKVIVLAFSIPDYTPTTPSFQDVPSAYLFYPYIEAMAQARIVHGVACGGGLTCFEPERAVTRAEAAVMLQAVAGYPVYTPSQPGFQDVPSGYFAYKAIETLQHLSIISGAPCQSGIGTCFSPGIAMQRDEVAKVVYLVRDPVNP